MSDADCTPGREPRSVAASWLIVGSRWSRLASSVTRSMSSCWVITKLVITCVERSMTLTCCVVSRVTLMLAGTQSMMSSQCRSAAWWRCLHWHAVFLTNASCHNGHNSCTAVSLSRESCLVCFHVVVYLLVGYHTANKRQSLSASSWDWWFTVTFLTVTNRCLQYTVYSIHWQVQANSL